MLSKTFKHVGDVLKLNAHIRLHFANHPPPRAAE